MLGRAWGRGAPSTNTKTRALLAFDRSDGMPSRPPVASLLSSATARCTKSSRYVAPVTSPDYEGEKKQHKHPSDGFTLCVDPLDPILATGSAVERRGPASKQSPTPQPQSSSRPLPSSSAQEHLVLGTLAWPRRSDQAWSTGVRGGRRRHGHGHGHGWRRRRRRTRRPLMRARAPRRRLRRLRCPLLLE